MRFRVQVYKNRIIFLLSSTLPKWTNSDAQEPQANQRRTWGHKAAAVERKTALPLLSHKAFLTIFRISWGNWPFLKVMMNESHNNRKKMLKYKENIRSAYNWDCFQAHLMDLVKSHWKDLPNLWNSIPPAELLALGNETQVTARAGCISSWSKLILNFIL